MGIGANRYVRIGCRSQFYKDKIPKQTLTHESLRNEITVSIDSGSQGNFISNELSNLRTSTTNNDNNGKRHNVKRKELHGV
jgi:hypothetical protein